MRVLFVLFGNGWLAGWLAVSFVKWRKNGRSGWPAIWLTAPSVGRLVAGWVKNYLSSLVVCSLKYFVWSACLSGLVWSGISALLSAQFKRFLCSLWLLPAGQPAAVFVTVRACCMAIFGFCQTSAKAESCVSGHNVDSVQTHCVDKMPRVEWMSERTYACATR